MNVNLEMKQPPLLGAVALTLSTVVPVLPPLADCCASLLGAHQPKLSRWLTATNNDDVSTATTCIHLPVQERDWEDEGVSPVSSVTEITHGRIVVSAGEVGLFLASPTSRASNVDQKGDPTSDSPPYVVRAIPSVSCSSETLFLPEFGLMLSAGFKSDVIQAFSVRPPPQPDLERAPSSDDSDAELPLVWQVACPGALTFARLGAFGKVVVGSFQEGCVWVLDVEQRKLSPPPPTEGKCRWTRLSGIPGTRSSFIAASANGLVRCEIGLLSNDIHCTLLTDAHHYDVMGFSFDEVVTEDALYHWTEDCKRLENFSAGDGQLAKRLSKSIGDFPVHTVLPSLNGRRLLVSGYNLRFFLVVVIV